MESQPDRGFYSKFLLFTIVAVCFLILVGGIVRSTGSGMGCPDWPKCFGTWVPPTSLDQLPQDYKEVYSTKRQEKNLKLANYIETLGFVELANRLRTDETILIETSFSPVKTWIEYLNRMVGVMIGFLVFLNIWLTVSKPGLRAFIKLAILIFLLTGFQGWVGSVVVSTNLLPGIITFHMILALVILGLLIYNYWLARSSLSFEIQHSQEYLRRASNVLIISFILIVLQIVFGTQVREGVDQIAHTLNKIEREAWVGLLGVKFYIHRSVSLLVFGMHAWFAFLILRKQVYSLLHQLVYALMASIALSIVTGIVLAYFSLPPYLQPLHLILATIIFGLDLYLILELRQAKQKNMTIEI